MMNRSGNLLTGRVLRVAGWLLGALSAIVLIFALLWGVLLHGFDRYGPGNRHLFCEWVSTTHGWNIKPNLFRDQDRHLLAVDKESNTVLLLLCDADCHGASLKSDSLQAVVGCGAGREWSIARRDNSLIIGSPDGEIHAFDVRPGFASAFSSVLERSGASMGHPQFDGDFATAILEEYAGQRVVELKDLLGASTRTAP